MQNNEGNQNENKDENETVPIVEGVEVAAGEAADYAVAKVADATESVQDKAEEIRDKVEEVKDKTVDYASSLVSGAAESVHSLTASVPPSQLDGAIKKAADIVDYAVEKAYDAKDYVKDKLHLDGPFTIETNWKSEKEEIQYLKNKVLELRSLIDRASQSIQTINERIDKLESTDAKVLNRIPGEDRSKAAYHSDFQPGVIIGAAQTVKDYAVGKIAGVTDYAVEKVANTTGYIQSAVYNTTGYDLGEKIQTIDQYAIDKVKQTIGIDVGESVHKIENLIGIAPQSDENKVNNKSS